MLVEHFAVPRSKRTPGEDRSSGKQKVMLYVPPEHHRAMRRLALEEGRSASDIYGESARALLRMRGVEVEAAPEPKTIHRPPAMADLAAMIDRQGRQIEDLLAAIDDIRDRPPQGSQAPAGTKAADAMKVILQVLGGWR